MKFKLTPKRVMLLVFLIPFIIRLIPELLAGHYPIGYDTSQYASIAMLRNPNSISFSEGPLFQILLISIRTLTNVDAFILIKFMGAFLYGLLGLAVYYFARSYLGWKTKKSFVAVLFIVLYFVTLRISWDLFRNELGLIFLFFALPWLKKLDSIRNCSIFATLSFLVVLSHPFVSAILFFIVIGLGLLNFMHSRNHKTFKPILLVLPAGIFFFICVFLSGILPTLTTNARVGFLEPTTGGGGLLFNYLLPNAWNPAGGYAALFGYVWILFIFSYALILFFVYKGFWREPVLGLWTIFLLVSSFSCIINPWGAIPYVDRWMFMLVFPFSFYAVNGLEKLRKSFSLKIFNKKITTTTAILTLFACLTGIYVASPIGVFQAGPASRSIPSTMLQASINLDVIPSTIDALEVLNGQMDNNSCLVLEQRFSAWAMIYLNENVNMIVYPANTSAEDALAMASNRGFSEIYLLWYSGLENLDGYRFDKNYANDKITIYLLQT
ncbi:MAG: hypothetical protein MUO36_01940 [Candidatus Hadarchaeum sp.]|nr:hypothetical protein [Candidatus Hadarchaeum sp.]